MKKNTTLFSMLFVVALCSSSMAKVFSADASYSNTSNSVSSVAQNPDGNNGKVVDIPNTAYFESLLDDSDSPSRNTVADRHIILDFTATWCGPCQAFKPMYEFVAGDYAGVVDFYRVDVDKNRELAEMFEITSIPTLVYIPIEGDPLKDGAPEDLYEVINSVFGLDVQP